jgi:hypothetical protein
MNTNSISISLLLLVSILVSACTEQPSTAERLHVAKSTTRPSLDQFPQADQILLATLQVKLEPNRTITMRAPSSGRLQLRQLEPTSFIEQDTVWGVMEQDALDAEATALDLWKQQLETRQEMETQLDLPLQRLQAQKQLDEVKRTLKVWEMYQQDSERGRRTMELLGIDPGSGNPAEIERLKWEAELLETQLRYLQSERPVSDLELQSRRVEWEQRRLEFLKKKSLAHMNAPFSGELRLLVRPQENRSEVWVQSGEEVAVLRDLSNAILRLKPDESPWSSAHFPDLLLKVHIPGYPELQALPIREEIETSSTKQERVWVFKLETKDQQAISLLPIGSPVSVRLIQTLPSVATLISKSTLISQANAKGEHWGALLQSIYPEVNLLAVGQTELAVELTP